LRPIKGAERAKNRSKRPNYKYFRVSPKHILYLLIYLFILYYSILRAPENLGPLSFVGRPSYPIFRSGNFYQIQWFLFS